jgi:uncharacterized membrane protein (UPF0182 family)
VLRLPGNTPFRGPRQVQQSFITNNQVRPGLTLFNSQDSKVVFGNLLTLPIGGSGLLYVEPLYVQGTGQNSFPLLQKILVNYADRVGYADTLQDALDQVFGPGAGTTATGGGTSTPPTGDGTTTPTTPAAPTTSPPSAGSGASNPAMDQAVAGIKSALDALKAAQSSGDFAAQGQALADLQKAVTAYQNAQQASASASPTG